MGNRPCHRCGSVKWFWSDGRHCNVCTEADQKALTQCREFLARAAAAFRRWVLHKMRRRDARR